MTYTAVTPVSGFNPNQTTAEPLFALKSQSLGDDGNQYVYGQATQAVAEAGVCTYNNADGTITAAGGGHTCLVPIPLGHHAWVFLSGSIHK